ncbi:hypothetical protein PGB34_22915 [Xenophilus arseniciresistens]|uniref:Uncharacterized protein n=1 Tax=Xenophilus arseniciresistens TaxID=1283306 RepID=A0AAE3NCP0_9BURK|nr:hypothetical protein [Xenophilus arseniciresistens]MDA7419236.1 hypothetical protein [Xenophilus arseniciresistens]
MNHLHRPWRVGARLLMLGASMLSVACHAGEPVRAQSREPQPLLTAPCVKKVPVPFKFEGYNDKLVDACLGPAHFRIPANYFRSQMGPDFEGYFSLLVQWPDLQPLAPGKRLNQDMATQRRQITITPVYVDRVPIETRLDASVEPPTYVYPADGDSPTMRLRDRDRQPERHGLTPYYVNEALYDAYINGPRREKPSEPPASTRNTRDWFLARDAQGRLTTVIKCSSHLDPDGLVLRGSELVREGSGTNADCQQEFIIPELKVWVSIAYPRALLPHWPRLEARARELFKQYRVR